MIAECDESAKIIKNKWGIKAETRAKETKRGNQRVWAKLAHWEKVNKVRWVQREKKINKKIRETKDEIKGPQNAVKLEKKRIETE